MLMQIHYGHLSEKDRRCYAAVEAEKLGHGGITYVSKVLGIDRKTIRQGKKDLLESKGEQAVGKRRQRKAGGGRKKNFG